MIKCNTQANDMEKTANNWRTSGAMNPGRYRGARRRGTPLSILGFRVGAVVAGGGGAVAWGSLEKKLGTGGPRGMAGAAVDRRWGVVSGRAGRLFGRWWLAAQRGAG